MAAKKVEIGVGLDIDTMPAERLREEINRITQSAEKLSSVDTKASKQVVDNLERQVSLMDKAIEKQKEFIRQQAAQAYKAGVDPETRGQMAADIFRQHREAGLAPPTEAEINRMVIQRGREMRVGVREERERLTTMQQRRREVQEAAAAEAEQRRQAEDERQARRGAIAGAGMATIGGVMRTVGIGAALIGAGGIVGTLIQGARWANELNNIMARINVQSDRIGDNIGRWGAGTAMARIEAARYAEQGLRAFGRGGMEFLPGLEWRRGFQQGELLRYAPMFRMAGMESEDLLSNMLLQAGRAARIGGREFDIFGLLSGTAMATDVLGRTLVTPSAPGTMTALASIQQAYGQGMSPERAARIGMQLHGAMTSQDSTRRAFMLRSLGFEGGNLADYQRAIMQIEKGVSDPENIRRMLERARTETGSREQMVQLVSGMGLSMTQASTLVDKYLTGEIMSDEQLQKLMAAPTEKEKEQAKLEERKVTALDNAVKSFKDLSTSLGQTTLTVLEPALGLAVKGMGKLEQAVIQLNKTINKWLGEEEGMPSARQAREFKGETLFQKEMNRLRKEIGYAERTGRAEAPGEGASWWEETMSWLRMGQAPSVLRKRLAAGEEIESMLKRRTLLPVGERGLVYDPRMAGTEGVPTDIWRTIRERSAGIEGKHQVFYRNSGNTFVIQATESSLADAMKIFERVTKEESAGGAVITPEEQEWIAQQPYFKGGTSTIQQIEQSRK